MSDSQLSLNGNRVLVPAVYQSFYYNQTLSKTYNGHFEMVNDTCEVLNVTANYDFGKTNS